MTSLVNLLSPAAYNSLVLEKLNRKQRLPWPTNYINASRKKPYKPHSQDEADFVYNDTPRYGLVKGGEGCIAAETLINGIPAAEWNGGNVTTLYGQQPSGATFQKGHADLYRVRTKLGRVVEVTSQHRFLTPTGWRQLQYLFVGSLLASHDSEHGRQCRQIAKGYRGYCSVGFHPYDELPTPAQADALSRLRQLAKILFSLFYLESCFFPLLSHLYSVCDFHLLVHSLLSYVSEFRLYQNDGVSTHQSFQHGVLQQLMTSQIDKAQLLPLNHEAFLSLEREFQLGLDGNLHLMELYSIGELYRKDTCHLLVSQELYYEVVILLCLYQNALFDLSVSLSSDYPFNNGIWDIIDDISFVGNKEYYDLTVPVYHHYEANGIIHHNSGKSTMGIIKDLERLRRGMSGILVSPTLPHFKKSLWPEFQAWCPAEAVISEQRYRLNSSWQPHEAFILNFVTGSTLICGGIENPPSWEGPNVNFWHLDEGRHAQAEAVKVLDGRCRIPGPNGEPPQGWITTTPKKNWLFEYFGPIQENDKYLNFKQNSLVVTLPLELNRENLADGYIENRRNSLTESEARVRVDAEWEDESDTEKFVNIFWWDSCYEQLPALTRSEPAILALDAPKGSENPSMLADSFAAVLVTRHPSRRDDVAVRYCGIWQPEPGKLMDYEPIENEIYRLASEFSLVEVCYDSYQLADMANRLRKRGINAKEFNQQKARLIADKNLQSAIVSRKISHDGNPLLKQHVDNADIVKHGDEGIRIVKRSQSLKVDGCVALSMARERCQYFNF